MQTLYKTHYRFKSHSFSNNQRRKKRNYEFISQMKMNMIQKLKIIKISWKKKHQKIKIVREKNLYLLKKILAEFTYED